MSRNPNLTIWKSHEVIEETVRRNTVEVADDLHVSERLVRKWKEAPSTLEDPDQSGARNPLDRISSIITTIEKIDRERAYLPIFWLNVSFGFLPPIKVPAIKQTPEDIQKAILKWTAEFGETCNKVSAALSDSRLRRGELKEIYRELLEDFQAGMGLFYLLKSRME